MRVVLTWIVSESFYVAVSNLRDSSVRTVDSGLVNCENQDDVYDAELQHSSLPTNFEAVHVQVTL